MKTNRFAALLLLLLMLVPSLLRAEELAVASPTRTAVSDSVLDEEPAVTEGFDEQSDDVTVLHEMDHEMAERFMEQDFLPPGELLQPLESDPIVTRRDSIGLVSARERHSLVERSDSHSPEPSRVDWERLRYLDEKIDLDIPAVNNVQVLSWIEFFSGRAKRWFQAYLERSGHYLPYIRKVFQERGLPMDLAYVAMIESGFTTEAKSWVGALGLWQFMAYTARPFGLRSDAWVEERINWRKSTHAAANYLEYCYAHLNNWPLAIAAYNAGHGKMFKAIDKYNSRDFWEISQYSYLARESRLYVPKLIAAAMIAKNPVRYGFTDVVYQAPEDVDLVLVPDPTDLASLAQCAGTDEETIRRLNPELRRGVTPPDAGPEGYEIAVPLGSGERFKERYAKLDRAKARRSLLTYTIKPGDFPGKIAQRFGVKVADLLALNNIKNTKGLQVGRELVVPTFGNGLPGYTGTPTRGMTTGRYGPPIQKKPGPEGATLREHRIGFGDTVERIAKRYKVSAEDLRAWNALRVNEMLIPGKRLLVYVDAPKPESEETADLDTIKVRDVIIGEPDRKGPKATVHVVRSGESLWQVANKYKVTVAQLKGWNSLRGNSLKIGQRLRVGR